MKVTLQEGEEVGFMDQITMNHGPRNIMAQHPQVGLTLASWIEKQQTIDLFHQYIWIERLRSQVKN